MDRKIGRGTVGLCIGIIWGIPMEGHHLCYVESVMDSGPEAESATATRSIRFLRVPADYESLENFDRFGRCFHWHYTNTHRAKSAQEWIPEEGRYYWLSESEARWKRNPAPPSAPKPDSEVFSHFAEWNNSILDRARRIERPFNEGNGARPPRWRDGDGLCITFMSVGFGDSAIIRWESGSLAVDGNGAALSSWRQYGFGKKSPFSAALITHPHRDHVSGIVSGIKESLFCQLFIGNNWGGSPHLKYVNHACKHAGFEHLSELGSSKGVLPLDGTNLFYAYPDEPVGTSGGSINSSSIQLAAKVGDRTVWLSGDAEKTPGDLSLTTAQWLASKLMTDGALTVVKIPHHGSDNGLLAEATFGLNLDEPQFSIISTGGRCRSWGMPAKSIAARSERIFRTDHCGDVTLTFTPSSGTTSVDAEASNCASKRCIRPLWCEQGVATPTWSRCSPGNGLCDVRCWASGRC